MIEAIVCPVGVQAILSFNCHQNPPVHAAPFRIETFQPIDGRQIETEVCEGHQLSVDQIPVAFRAGHGIFRQLDGVLCSGIGQRISSAMRQYIAVRDFQCRESGGQMIKPTPCGGGFDANGPGAEPVVVPKSPFQGSVNKEP